MNIYSPFKKESPDFSFLIIENTSASTNIGVARYSSADRRIRSIGTIQTVREMNELMSKSFEIIAPLGNLVKKHPDDPVSPVVWEHPSGIFFAPDFPDFLIPLGNPGHAEAPTSTPASITWAIVRKEAGTMSGRPFSGTQEIKPRFREFIAIFNDKNRQWLTDNDESRIVGGNEVACFVRVEGQFFDNLVQYNIWQQSNTEAEILTEWFEDYMDRFRGMFREAGVVQTVFDRRIRDDVLLTMKNGYNVRSVLYYVRTERIHVENISPIKRIDLKISVTDLRNLVNSTYSDQIIDNDVYNRVLNKWIPSAGY